MSHHDHDHDHDHECRDHHRRDHDRGGPDTRFLDLEISKVLFSEADGVTREAFRELLKEAAKRRLQERWGDRITALANLAIDELLEDVAANSEIEAKIAARNEARRTLEDRVSEILARPASAGESDPETGKGRAKKRTKVSSSR
jgi:histone H3/H4